MNRNIWHLLPLMNIELNENAGLPLSRRFHVHTQLRKLFMVCSPESHHTHTDIHYYHNCQMDSHLAHDHSSHYSISLSMKCTSTPSLVHFSFGKIYSDIAYEILYCYTTDEQRVTVHKVDGHSLNGIPLNQNGQVNQEWDFLMRCLLPCFTKCEDKSN